MPRRRQSRYDDDDKPQPSPSFNWGQIVNIVAIPFVTAAVVFIGQWAITGDTMKRHDESIKQIVVSREDEKKSRESMRDNFMASQGKLIEVLGKLDTRLSVSEKQQEAVSKQVDKISDMLQQRPGAPRR